MLRYLFKRAAANRRPLPAASAPSFMPLYAQKFAPRLAHRAGGFGTMFELLETRCRTLDRPALIVETGSMRAIGNWEGDGQSTLLWKEFSAFHPCEIHSIDLDPGAAEVVREACGDAVHAHTGDSVAYLHKMAQMDSPPQIDLLYLDSFDFEPSNPFPSAMHHVKELMSVGACLRKGSIVAIDDNFIRMDDCGGHPTGKGYLAREWFRDLDIPCVYPGYQLVWQL